MRGKKIVSTNDRILGRSVSRKYGLIKTIKALIVVILPALACRFRTVLALRIHICDNFERGAFAPNRQLTPFGV